jgi:hypothetical protein
MIGTTEYTTPEPVLSSEALASARHALKEEMATEELQTMLHQESNRYDNRFDYLSIPSSSQDHSQAPSSNERVSEGWRRKICEWSFEVVDHFGFDREVVSIALDYLDRVVSLKTRPSGEAMHRRDFQLIAVTCLYLAIKVHGETDTFDGPRRKLKIHAFVELSRGLFSVETLEAKEREILEMLEWKVNPPTTVRIVATVLRLMPTWNEHGNATAHTNTATAIYEMSRYLTELAVCVSTFAFNYKTSEIAYASILCAMEALQHKVHIPYGIRMQFLKMITGATKLTPHSVSPICSLLKELCPAMFAQEESGLTRTGSVSNTADDTPLETGGKVSPVCVMNQCREEEASPRKRGRQV